MHKFLILPIDEIYLDSLKDAGKSSILDKNYSKAYYIKAKLFLIK